METQVFDLENKVVVATSELDRMRHNLWSMEEDRGGEVSRSLLLPASGSLQTY